MDSILSRIRNARPSDYARYGIGVLIVVGLVCGYAYQEGLERTELVVQSQSFDGEASAKSDIVVHVTGAVNEAGVYRLEEGLRVMDAIDAAGGFSDDAASESLNLARVLSDGEQIIVPSMDQVSDGVSMEMQASASGGLVNINNANETQLQELSGIGPALAKRIVDYREKYGPYKKPEDLKNVSGIGEKKYAAIEGEICV